MALKLYFDNASAEKSEVTSGTDFSNPITTTHDGKNGDFKSVCLYIKNDDAALWYSNIEILPVDLVDASPYGDVAYDETGWGIKLNEGGDEPTPSEWNDIDWGKKLSVEDIGSVLGADTTTYFPFWYLITCPPNTNAQNKSDIILRVSFTENSVTV